MLVTHLKATKYFSKLSETIGFVAPTRMLANYIHYLSLIPSIFIFARIHFSIGTV